MELVELGSLKTNLHNWWNSQPKSIMELVELGGTKVELVEPVELV